MSATSLHESVPDKELWQLVGALCDGTLTESTRDRLEKVLASDPTTKHFVAAYIDLHAQLLWRCREAVDPNEVYDEKTEGLGKCWDDLLHNNVQLTSVDSPVPATRTSETVNDRAHHKTVFYRRSTLARYPIGVTWISIVAVGLAYYSTVAFLFWGVGKPRDQQPSRDAERLSSIATVESSTNCRWKSSAFRDGSKIFPNQVLQVKSGSAKVQFNGGATVVIEGPVEFTVHSASLGHITHGKLAAHVPPRAIGFEITTPTARVVDRGTQFELDVTSKVTRVAVLVGQVDLVPTKTGGTSKRQTEFGVRRLSAGQAVAVRTDPNELTSVEDIHSTASWLSKSARSALPKPDALPVVAYSCASGISGNQSNHAGGVGLDFDVRVPIRIFSLGVFDHLGDGIDPATSPTVQLWSRDDDDIGHKLVASVTFSADDSGELKLGHRFKSLPKPIDLPVGAYSIVAYGLSNANPFVMVENSDSNVDFSVDPGWIGVNNTHGGNQFGWSSTTNHAREKAGEVGGVFARCTNESSYGDTILSQTFSLHDAISASGSFCVTDVETMDGQFFVGHYSSSPAFSVREFIGMEFTEGEHEVRVHARMYLRDGSGFQGAKSSWIDLNASQSYHFEYVYDPTYEADRGHAGPEGKVTLRVHDDKFLVDRTVVAVLEGGHRDSYTAFDAFGMGVAMAAVSSDDATKTVRAFIDNVHYSGLQGKDFLASTVNGSERLVPQKQIETWHGSIVPTGSRLEECEPGTFPKEISGKKIGYAAGSFEYAPQGIAEGEKR